MLLNVHLTSQLVYFLKQRGNGGFHLAPRPEVHLPDAFQCLPCGVTLSRTDQRPGTSIREASGTVAQGFMGLLSVGCFRSLDTGNVVFNVFYSNSVKIVFY